MARSGQSSAHAGKGTTTQRRPSQKRSSQRHARPGDDTGLIPVLARAVREVENAAERGKVGPSNRTKFQVIALLMREERARAKTDAELTDAERTELLKRLDGVATILAKTAARDTSLIQLLAEETAVTDAARTLRRDMLIASGAPLSPGRTDHHQGAGGRRSGRGEAGGAAVGASGSAGQPVPRPRLQRRCAQAENDRAARQLGTARSAVPRLRIRGGRGSGDHGAAGGDLR